MVSETGIWKKEDLYPAFVRRNRDIYAVEIHAPSNQIAWALGREKAFLANYTSFESVCDLIEIDFLDIQEVN